MKLVQRILRNRLLNEFASMFIPKAHHYTCWQCNKPVHPWENECPFCNNELHWRKEMKMGKPDWFSRIFERNTSYKRWLARR